MSNNIQQEKKLDFTVRMVETLTEVEFKGSTIEEKNKFIKENIMNFEADEETFDERIEKIEKMFSIMLRAFGDYESIEIQYNSQNREQNQDDWILEYNYLKLISMATGIDMEIIENALLGASVISNEMKVIGEYK